MATGRAGAEQHDDKAQEGKQGEVVYPPILPHVSAEDSMQGNREGRGMGDVRGLRQRLVRCRDFDGWV
jgi:hypothetical protein